MLILSPLIHGLQRQRRWILIFIFYFSYLSFLAIHVSQRESSISPYFSPWFTPDDVISRSFYGDPTYFLQAALDMSSTGWYTHATQWISRLWPPGFVILQSFIIRLFGLNVPIPFVLQAISCLLFALNLTLLSKILTFRGIAFPYSVVAPLFIFTLSSNRGFYLGPYGVVFGESIATALFVMGILLACLAAISSQRILLILGSSVAIGLSAYFRSQFELYVNSVAVVFVLTSLFYFFRFKSCSLWRYFAYFKLLMIGLLICFFVMLPWRSYRIMHEGTSSWVSTSNLVYRNSVKSTKDLVADGGNFVVEGGGNLSCALEPSECNNFAQAKSIFYRTFFRYLPSWVSVKAFLLPRYAFAEYAPDSLVMPLNSFSFYSVFSRLLLLGAFVILAARSLFLLVNAIQRNLRIDWLQVIALVFVAGVLMASVPIWLLCHFEVRYFFSPWLFLSVFVILLLPGKHVSSFASR